LMVTLEEMIFLLILMKTLLQTAMSFLQHLITMVLSVLDMMMGL